MFLVTRDISNDKYIKRWFNITQILTMGNNIFVAFKKKIIFLFLMFQIAILRSQIAKKYNVLH